MRSTVAGSDAQRALQPGDLLLAIAGRPITSFPDLEAVLASLPAPGAALPQEAGGAATPAAGNSPLSLEASGTAPPALADGIGASAQPIVQSIGAKRAADASADRQPVAKRPHSVGLRDGQQPKVALKICRDGQLTDVDVKVT